MTWNFAPNVRSRKSIQDEAGKVKGQAAYSVKHEPIATIPANCEEPLGSGVVADVMHARMRVGDQLVKGSIGISSNFTGDKLAKGFEGLVRSLGVRFTTYEATIHGKVSVESSSLTGVNWRKLFAGIGPAIRNSSGVFPEEMKGRLAALYEDFHELLSIMGKCERKEAAVAARKACVWAQAFVGMGWRPTPYIHIITTHFPHTIKLFGGLDRFSGEWVEAANDQIKKTHMQKTNRRSPKLTLQTQLRLEFQEAEAKVEAMQNPTARKRKLNDDRAESAKQREKKKRMEEETERVAATRSAQSPYVDLSVRELREVIYLKTGERTRKQNPESLRAILHRIDGNA